MTVTTSAFRQDVEPKTLFSLCQYFTLLMPYYYITREYNVCTCKSGTFRFGIVFFFFKYENITLEITNFKIMSAW